MSTLVGERPAASAGQPRRRAPRRLLLVLLVVALSAAAMAAVKILVPTDDRIGGYDVPVVIGAVPYWDEETARQSIDAHGAAMTVASPWTYAVAADGSVVPQIGIDAAGEAVQATWLGERGLSVIPTIANTTAGAWDAVTISTVINDPGLRAAHIASIVDLVMTNGYDGVQIDYEDLDAADRWAFSAFVGELADSLHAIDKLLYVTVHPKTDDSGYDGRNEAQDYAAIGAVADMVFVMTYDWHWETSSSGPIAPYGWMERVVQYTVSQIPAEKIILGVGLYGYDWVDSQGEAVTWSQVRALADRYQVQEQWDEASASPYLSYTGDDGRHHDVWFENARSVQAKFDLARIHRLGGIGLWRLGGEDPGIWAPGP